jgi:SAM-dependent methyltransferase
MTERYDSTAARHYAAFRPPLHGLILDRAIRPNESFQVGLDVGCGTGYSAVALAKYCDRVFGLDPSRSMLDAAQRHPRITYIHGSGDALSQLPVQAFGKVKSDTHTTRTSPNGARVVSNKVVQQLRSGLCGASTPRRSLIRCCRSGARRRNPWYSFDSSKASFSFTRFGFSTETDSIKKL